VITCDLIETGSIAGNPDKNGETLTEEKIHSGTFMFEMK
jgi:hypothetical protein